MRSQEADEATAAIIERAAQRPGYVADKSERVADALPAIAAMGRGYGESIALEDRFSQHDIIIRAKLHSEMVLDGQPLHETAHFVTVYDVYSAAALNALRYRRRAAKPQTARDVELAA